MPTSEDNCPHCKRKIKVIVEGIPSNILNSDIIEIRVEKNENQRRNM